MEWPEHKEDEKAVKELIQREIQSIASLEERVVFKDLMEGVFWSLYETSQSMYKGLENRVEKELDFGQSHYQVKTGIMEKEYFDITHHLLSPMDERDLKEAQYDMKELYHAVLEEGRFPLTKVMLHCDYLEILRLWEENPVFEGVIFTENPAKEWKIKVCLRENREYIEKLNYLYKLFIKNGIPWQTVNAPYLYKIADAVVTEIPKEMTGSEKIQKITVQFGEYSHMIQSDIIPVWNMKKITLEGIGFPTPCIDHKNYEHSISIREYGQENAYLVEDDNIILSVSQEEDKLRIISEAGEAKKWDVYMLKISEERKIDSYSFPVMGNGREESFSDKYRRRWNQNIRTKTELAHFIKGFCLEDYVVYQDCEVADHFPGRKETYSMNPFITEEIRDPKSQKKLVLYFKKGEKEPWLQRDILSFLTSEVQRLYPEYDCGGVIL